MICVYIYISTNLSFLWKGLWFQRVECSELILLLLDMDTEVLSTCVSWLQRTSLRMEVLYEWLQLPEFLKRTHSIFLPHSLPSGECNFLKESMCDFSLIPWDACRLAFKGTLYWSGCVFTLSHRLRRFFFRRVFAEESKEVPSGRVFQRLIGVVSLADVDKAGMTSWCLLMVQKFGSNHLRFPVYPIFFYGFYNL